ncbi:cytochrome c oxidase subunit 6C-2-like [Diorhabda carinulata]|uniref:cytochrome c oxidase subunit 6C-2 n=1 Tax=Diorhabda sublineata TaxID=1163346 RepID=UPI0024E08C55|nr:cytochrome c oxidase subunit 6C-2 [Diorhabda sublineata]XP_057663369.1 cytochrome c oxidase subunit 6C-2-like [Diorhabda carinulata]XP_057663370.1 cytochrome c oxidase subunit 6C-2-like [Diorhabda carinulata]XP_057663371.1 cytochrome c oxidase subunit 6C-2-like [Diorhabda carinulata]
MAGGEVSKAVKPQLRGLLAGQIKRNIIFAAAVATLAAIAQKIFVNDNRKRAYAEFYRTYDIEKSFNEIRNKGLFDSCEPDE